MQRALGVWNPNSHVIPPLLLPHLWNDFLSTCSSSPTQQLLLPWAPEELLARTRGRSESDMFVPVA